MKHAGPETIERLTPMLSRLRAIGALNEKKPGIFYWKSRAFLHFHEHGDSVYADVRFDGSEFERLPCSTATDQSALIARISRWVEHPPAARPR